MLEYRSYSGLDDRVEKDGDVGFVGFNNRLRPDQLAGGMLADAQNVRMDRNGQAQVRKGIDLVEAPFTVTASVLRLPTTAQVGDGITAILPMNIVTADLGTTTADKVTIKLTNLAGTSLAVGDSVTVSGIAVGSLADPNGVHTLTDVDASVSGFLTVKYALDDSGGTGPYTVALRLPITYTSDGFVLNDIESSVVGSTMILSDALNTEVNASAAFSDPNDSASQHIIIASNASAVARNLSTGAVVTLNYPSNETVPTTASMLQAFNKVFIFRNGSTTLENNLRISTISSASVASSTDLVTITTSTNHNLVTGEIVTINGLLGAGTDGAFTTLDPNGSTKTITKTGDTTFTFALDVSGNETYTVSSTSVVSTDFTKVASGTYTQPTTITSSVCNIINNRCTITASSAHNLKVGDIILCTKKGDSTLITDQFTQISSVAGVSTVAEKYLISSIGGDLSLSNGAASRDGSTTTVKVQFDGTNLVSTSNLSIGDGITIAGATGGGSGVVNGPQAITAFSTTGSTANDTLEFTVSGLDASVGGTSVTADDLNNFSFNSNNSITDKANADITIKPEFIRRVSVGLGFTHMPAPEFAVYHQRRLVMPFKFDVGSSADTYTSRGILDEIIASDILDTDTYDQIYAQYRFNAGEADFVVGLHSFSEDNLMVFNRNSIHMVSNTTTLQGASTNLLTDEVGCVARDTIRQVGNQVIFLSDNGVYSTQFFDEYNLRGTETPLSEPINSTIERIQREYWSKSVAVYFDNRYYIAVPLDTFQDGTANNAGVNNALLIYNFLNKQWESIDQVNDNNWNIEHLIVAGEGTQRLVYAINSLGGIHSIDSRVQGDDLVRTQISQVSDDPVPIKGSVTTRQYTLGNLNRKSWKEFELHVESSEDNDSDLDISAVTENPDATVPLRSLSQFNGSRLEIAEDVSIRGRIGNRRGHGIQFIFNNTVGRPKIRAIRTSGSTSFRSTQKAI